MAKRQTYLTNHNRIADFMRQPCRQASEHGEVLRALGFTLRERERLPTPIVLHEV